jgi:hypothetical protein
VPRELGNDCPHLSFFVRLNWRVCAASDWRRNTSKVLVQVQQDTMTQRMWRHSELVLGEADLSAESVKHPRPLINPSEPRRNHRSVVLAHQGARPLDCQSL